MYALLNKHPGATWDNFPIRKDWRGVGYHIERNKKKRAEGNTKTLRGMCILIKEDKGERWSIPGAQWCDSWMERVQWCSRGSHDWLDDANTSRAKHPWWLAGSLGTGGHLAATVGLGLQWACEYYVRWEPVPISCTFMRNRDERFIGEKVKSWE